MILLRKIVFSLCLAVILQHVSGQEKKVPAGYDFFELDRKINSWVDSGFYRGASILIAKDNKVIHQQYYGNYQPQTVVYIANAAEWLTTATIAAVVDDGKLRWDDKVKKWLPQCKGNMGEATLRQLLSHTAGFPDDQPQYSTREHQTTKELMTRLANMPADTVSGTKFKYDVQAMQLAWHMAEVATGKDGEAIFQEKIAVPLQMKNTCFTPAERMPEHDPVSGAGCLTSLADYANFLNMVSNDGLFKGRRVLSAAALKEMEADQIGTAKVLPGEFVENVRASRRNDIYGLGQWREETDQKGNAVLLSSPGWAGAYPWIDKKNHLYGFFLARASQVKNGFNPFYASPVLPYLVRDALHQAAHPEVKHGYIVTAGKAKLYYEERGKGVPLIFIHGHSFDHTEWYPQFFALSKKYRVICYDVRGYGRSSMPAEHQTALHADDLAALMDQLKIAKAHIAGLSLGGYIVSDFLVLYPNRILTATVASAGLFSVKGPSEPWPAAEWALQDKKIAEWQLKGTDVMKRKWLNALTIRNGQVIAHLREPIWKMIYKWDAWQPQHHEPRFLLGNDLPEKLKAAQITVPVLILTGDADAGRQNKLLQFIPQAKQVFIKNAGHVSNLENAEGFTDALADFLKAYE